MCGDPGQVDCPTTDSNGVATLDGVDLSNTFASADVNAGSYTGAVRAQFTGDMSTNAATGTGDLDVAQAQNVVALSFTSPLFLAPDTELRQSRV